MKTLLRTCSLALVTVFGLSASAQQPYSVTITGTVSGCSGNSFVNIATMPSTSPTIDIDVPVLPPSCSFTVTLNMASQGGGFVVTTPCLGAMQSQVVQYQVPAIGDSTAVSVTFNCGNSAIDCLGVPGGTAMPGTACTTFLGVSGTWSANCTCVANSGNLDCEGVANGNAQPGTPCSTPNGATGVWSADCECIIGNVIYDCLQVANGPNMPGTPCWVLGTNFIGLWDSNCACVDSTNTGPGCSAAFWAMQAMEFDSLNNPNGGGSPIPYEVWVWNLSSGNGPMTYFWDFGDGSTSNLAYPSHTYSGNGPYLLCLTIADASGCTSVSCDSISMDGNGILQGMVLEEDALASAVRQDGFTINVQNPLTLAVGEESTLSNAALWPNPTTGELNLALVSLSDGAIDIAIHDVSGRVVLNARRSATIGRSQHSFDTSELPSGLYTMRATDRNGKAISLRFVKAD
ncbi:MAG TPA: PKD domain-containing protein [Flavobacteriales bacterium]|nr:PKD domain-containing protein [Flavobacteriales bacterium]